MKTALVFPKAGYESLISFRVVNHRHVTKRTFPRGDTVCHTAELTKASHAQEILHLLAGCNWPEGEILEKKPVEKGPD